MNRKKEKRWLFASFVLPLLLAISLFQAYHFNQLRREVERLNDKQSEWFEQNRRLASSIATYSSPSRISQLAQQELVLSKDEERNVIRIVIEK